MDPGRALWRVVVDAGILWAESSRRKARTARGPGAGASARQPGGVGHECGECLQPGAGPGTPVNQYPWQQEGKSSSLSLRPAEAQQVSRHHTQVAPHGKGAKCLPAFKQLPLS